MQGLPSYIHFTTDPDHTLDSIVSEMQPDKVVILVDENTRQYCLPLLSIAQDGIIEIQSGEKSKTLETCTAVWEKMTDLGLGRKSLMINLGGGVIGDMGGFIASTYKRGIRFVNIPTTLLSQVDASIGGKLGIDFQGLKNHIGVFKDPDAVILSDVFLKTLDQRQLRSGFAEVIKHGLIWDRHYLEKTKDCDFPKSVDWAYLLRRSVEIKSEVVTKDPFENGLRKILNFGHTLGHAVETFHLENHLDILHGEAIAIGMIMELNLSLQYGWLDQQTVDEISHWLLELYGYISTIPETGILISLMSHDKKNASNKINFSLVDTIGTCKFDIQPDEPMINKAVSYYRNLGS